jgi:tetratricopeptide (TPR) repeat protein
MRIAFAMLVAAVFGMDAEAAVRVYQPASPDEIVLRVGSSSEQTQLTRLRSMVRDNPSDIGARMSYVDALIDEGARTGNERYYGFAEQALLAAGEGSDDRVSIRRAQLLQHRHEFQDAERVLGEILERDWRNADARLMRAQVRLHLWKPREALQDCAALAQFANVLTTATCIAQAHAALGDVTRGYQLVMSTLDTQRGDTATRSWSAGVAAELAARLGDTKAAGRHYRDAFELDPSSHYVRMQYADWLLSEGSDEAAMKVAGAGASLADRARVVLAARNVNSAEAHRLQLAWDEAGARGERGHLRDQARFELLLKRDVAKAHATAMASFREHGEPDDALILAQTAAATSDSGAVREIEAWRKQRRYEDVRLASFLRRAL